MVDAPVEARPSVADALRNAKEILVERGWCQNGLINSQGQVCAVGALILAGYGDQPLGRVNSGGMRPTAGEMAALARAVARMRDRPFADNGDRWRVEAWNDRPGRTADQVLDLFSLAIELEESG